MVEVVHQLGQLAGVVEVGVVVELGGFLHPGQVRAGGEVPAAAAHDEEAHVGGGLDGVQGEDQLADHPGVEGVVLLRAIEPEGGDAVVGDVQLQGGEVGHRALL
ncbi:hypothetical protein D3C85_1478340 [compost metagenome]